MAEKDKIFPGKRYLEYLEEIEDARVNRPGRLHIQSDPRDITPAVCYVCHFSIQGRPTQITVKNHYFSETVYFCSMCLENKLIDNSCNENQPKNQDNRPA